jgi:hypothetical protein
MMGFTRTMVGLLVPFVFVFSVPAHATAPVTKEASAGDIAKGLKIVFESMTPFKAAPGSAVPFTFDSRFSVHGCVVPLQSWLSFLYGNDITLTFKFAPNCDISGTVNITHYAPFLVNLTLRHFGNYSSVSFLLHINEEHERWTGLEHLRFEGTRGRLNAPSGPPTEFIGDYAIVFDWHSFSLAQNLGGTLKITRMRGLITDYSFPLLF